ncbi:hypothetical protein EFO61_06335 [Lacticaseibacillus rhamnosus]|nr:hypothetical protein BVH57_03840 [Lacticaseibacillus rhamnosus]EHJ21469.1 hypothetical protein R0011_10485 [Lacticaseibacillus rhamnosus R0011]EHJ24762.1 hypothetical protein HMPREF0541_03033 [Lacticaseibacillus rhamnosus ATCC 21052]OFT15364.1 hypothetical protein HMPREF3068_09385 [Lactobacillus sp. HMSC17G08]KIX27177.1 hypothetical protein NP51_13590 [Lacticaseibacillus rhamnosus]
MTIAPQVPTLRLLGWRARYVFIAPPPFFKKPLIFIEKLLGFIFKSKLNWGKVSLMQFKKEVMNSD